MANLATYLKSKREAVKLSQDAVGKKLGYTTGQFLSNWESGRSTPPPEAIGTLAAVYEVDKKELTNLVVGTLLSSYQEAITHKYGV